MRRILFVILSAMLILALVSCQSTKETEQAQALQGQPWVNSNIYGNWPATRPKLEENYELFVNYDLYMKALSEGKTQDDLYTQAANYQETKIKELIADTSKTSDELELIRAYYRLFADFDKRNAEGNQPLINYRDMIVKQDTLEDLSAEVRNGLVFGNPFASFKIDKASDGSGTYGVYIDFELPISSRLSPGYSDEDYANVKQYLLYLLSLASYDGDYAAKIVDLIEQYEIKAAQLDEEFMEKNNLEDDVVVMNLDEIKDFCAPLYDLIVGLGYYSESGDPVCYTIYNAGMFYGIDQMYMQDNLEIIEAIYVLAMADYAQCFIDLESYATALGAESFDEFKIEDISYDFITEYLPAAVDQVYLEFVFPEGLRDKIIDLTKKYITAMEERLKSETWLSESTLQKALEKIKEMVYVVVYPDEWMDYGVLKELVQDHDQFLLDAVLCRDDFYRAYTTSFLGKEMDRGNWVFSKTKTTEANAYYVSSENSINILAGILYDTLYYDDSTETILASIGATIGHEITHGFDTSGAEYNSVGDPENWWTEEDASNFKERANRIADALSEIQVADGYNVNGEFVLDEMVADIGGVALSLDLTKQYHDFNYDEFFKTYALMWYSIYSDVDAALALYMSDNHPANYIRANFVVQMFDEFYDTYPEVKDGTAMYRSPGDRLSVW